MIHRSHGLARKMPAERRATSPSQQKKKISGASQRHAYLPHNSGSPWGHPATTQNWRSSGQMHLVGPRLEDVIVRMFASGLRKLGRRHTTALTKPESKILEGQLQGEIVLEKSPSTVKTVLSAVTRAAQLADCPRMQESDSSERPRSHSSCVHPTVDHNMILPRIPSRPRTLITAISPTRSPATIHSTAPTTTAHSVRCWAWEAVVWRASTDPRTTFLSSQAFFAPLRYFQKNLGNAFVAMPMETANVARQCLHWATPARTGHGESAGRIQVAGGPLARVALTLRTRDNASRCWP